MPSTATITAYHTFAIRTKAKSSQVNVNFQNERGHKVPTNTDTATASDNAHDLGATDHRWRRAYLGNAPYVNGVQTNRFEISDIYDGSSATELVDPIGELGRIAFPTDRDTDVRFQFIVPPTYVIGQRIGLALKGYAEATGSTVFYSTTRLHRVGTTNISGTSTPAEVLTVTATLANSVAGLIVEDTSLKLTDSSGLVNGVTVSVGDILSVQLKRATSATGDTNTGRWFALGIMAELNN